MTLPASGDITLGQVETEILNTGDITLGEAEVRALAAKKTGDITLGDLLGADQLQYTLSAAASGSSIGFGSGFGTLSNTAFLVSTIVQAADITASGRQFQLKLSGSYVQNTAFRAAQINGRYFYPADAAFSLGNTWTWPTDAGMVAGVQYELALDVGPETFGVSGTPTTPPTVQPVGAGGNWSLAFEDHFDGVALNTAKWNTVYTGQTEPAVQNYDLVNSCLRIWPATGYVNRALTTRGKFTQKYGFYEARMKLPIGRGTIPSFWCLYDDTGIDRPQINTMIAFPGGIEQVTGGGFTTRVIIDAHGDQMSYLDGATGIGAASPWPAVADAGLDTSGYDCFGHGIDWNSANRLRQGINTTDFATQMASASAKVVILQLGWSDYYEGRTQAQVTADLVTLVDIARTAAIPKFVILATPNETDDSTWEGMLTAINAAATQRSCPVIDIYTYAKNYRISNNLDIYSLCPDGFAPNAAHHARIGDYVKTRVLEIKAADATFPVPTGSSTSTAGGGNWGTATYHPTDYAGRIYSNMPALIAQRRLTNSSTAADLSTAFHVYGMKWEADGVTFYFDGVAVGSKLMTSELQTYAMHVLVSLWFETTPSSLLPNTTDTPQGNTNAFQIDYVRVWQVAATTPAPTATITPRPIPNYSVSLASYGGVPGALPATIISAFQSAYTALKTNGGGTLVIPPGIYDLGNQSGDATVIGVSALNNVLISGYGATLQITTTDFSSPTILQFTNSANLTVAGLRFTDPGTDLTVG